MISEQEAPPTGAQQQKSSRLRVQVRLGDWTSAQTYKVLVDIRHIASVKDFVLHCHEMLGSSLPPSTIDQDVLVGEPDTLITSLHDLATD